jgi:CRISPR-associated exonuclease Cas4
MSIAALLIVLALAVLALALWLRGRTGLPWARVTATDTGAGRKLERPLFARRYGLTGRPDYLIECGNATIPVEVKPGRRAAAPYHSDLMQLAAYCLLVEEQFGQAPPYGLLRYANATFRLDYTPDVRAELLAILAEMHDVLDADDVARDHAEARRCAACGFRDACEDSLA